MNVQQQSCAAKKFQGDGFLDPLPLQGIDHHIPSSWCFRQPYEGDFPVGPDALYAFLEFSCRETCSGVASKANRLRQRGGGKHNVT